MDFKKNSILSSNAGFHLLPLYTKYDHSLLTCESVNVVRPGRKVFLYYSKIKWLS